MLWILKPSGCTLWVSSIHQMGKFVPMIDWQVFQIRAVLGTECWLAVMRQSGLLPWSRQRMLWHNLAAGLTGDEKRFRGQKVGPCYWHKQQSAQMSMESFSAVITLRITFINFIKDRSYLFQFAKTIDEAFRRAGFTPDTLLSSLKSLLVLQMWINIIRRHIWWAACIIIHWMIVSCDCFI